MHWVIQSNMYAETGFEQLVNALVRQGISHSIHKVVPFAHTLEPEITPPPGAVMVMGTLSLCKIAQERGWKPGAITNENFDFFVQSNKWPGKMLNDDALGCLFGDVPEQSKPFFMRPVHDTKAFSGFVLDWPMYTDWRDKVAKLSLEVVSTLELTTPVVIASTKEIYREYRMFVVNRRVVTGSMYKVGSRVVADSNVDPRVYEFTSALNHEMVPDSWGPADAYAIDIADTPNGLKIIEVNCINSAGWYAADMNKLVAALDKMCFEHPCIRSNRT